jgi:cytidylate kinase
MAVLSTIRAQAMLRDEQAAVPADAVRFITISRQAGAGAKQFAARLAERLNARSSDGPRWTSWDRELVEKIAQDDHLSTELIDSLTEHSRSWVDQLLADVGSTVSKHVPDDFRIYRRVAQAIRALAQHGRVIVVGRGGMCITRDMRGGLHIRLVAPLEHRINALVGRYMISRTEAAGVVHGIDLGRADFYRHFFPEMRFAPEQFSVTFNTSAVTEDQLLSAIVALIDNATLPAPPISVVKPVRGKQSVS